MNEHPRPHSAPNRLGPGTVVITAGALIDHRTQVDSRGNLLLLRGSDPAAGWWNAVQAVFFPLLAACWLASTALVLVGAPLSVPVWISHRD